MSKRWLQEKKRDYYYKQAKRERYRSRAAYKLFQIQDKFGLMREGDAVVDLGAAPGGWSQAAAEIVGRQGIVVGVDLQSIEPMVGCEFIRGDMTQQRTVDELVRVLRSKGFEQAGVVVSDMSPNISGQYSRDQAQSVYLAGHALAFAKLVLKKGGSFLVKVFEGEDYPEYIQELKGHFSFVKPFSPPASRSSSSEIYVVCKNFYG